MRTRINSLAIQKRLPASAAALSVICAFPTLLGQSVAPGAPEVDFGSEAVHDSVAEIAAIVGREYMDPVVGKQVADSLRRRLKDGQYTSQTPAALAARLTNDLQLESKDKHLVVAVVRDRVPAPGASTRQEQVRRTNGGVQRVEILPENVGYLNMTAFWRVEEAQDVIADAMRLLQRADALIIDMRQNRGGSPETAVLLMGYLFDQVGLPLFDIVPRSGDHVSYSTPTPGPPERNGHRPLYVLTAAGTFSAGEGVAFLLQERARAEVIGERTAGAANPGRPYRVNAFFDVTVPNGRVVSAVSGRNWEGSGVLPDVVVTAPDALGLAHSRALARLLASAK